MEKRDEGHSGAAGGRGGEPEDEEDQCAHAQFHEISRDKIRLEMIMCSQSSSHITMHYQHDICDKLQEKVRQSNFF